ncbi:MAG TPA: 16S rRNA (cytosine(1402)-N(4))-methyltransferase RsmH [Tepidisphaeraceae bacterium]|jgi:16S rRNA (cytosine1402-N4)-methyltransferase|nr:16S rRNA (cytosine(1402)-N(4))-methyltransferase RsmH [Tepidisphaeraceae bacterium]
MRMPESGHEAVLMEEVMGVLAPGEGKVVVDCTVGRGGHSLELARRVGKSGMLVGLDVDPRNLEFAGARLAEAPAKVRLFHANFAELGEVLGEVGVSGVDGILADLGISTNQLFDEQYGLSFSSAMPLDMRLDSRLKRTAADVVNYEKEKELADLLFTLAQEHYSRQVARKIVEARRISPITTTERLADIVRSAIPKRGGAPQKIDPATRTFLALRMHVNQELESLAALLDAGPRFLNSGGTMAVISFQSMEDRLVKQAYRSAEQAGKYSLLTKKPITPAEAELASNPRSRSAKLRAIRRVG